MADMSEKILTYDKTSLGKSGISISNLWIQFVHLLVVTPFLLRDGGTVIQVYAVNLIEIRLGERSQPIAN